MTTPAQVIGENVKTLREYRMTAEEFGRRIGEYFGKPWPRQTVYMMEQGRRRLAAEEVVAIALILDVSIADLFTPAAKFEEVKVGSRGFPRERLLTHGEPDSERLYEVARHVQALRRSFRDIFEMIKSQQLVIANIDNALRGEPPSGLPSESPSHELGSFIRQVWESTDLDYERAQEWYDAVASVPPTETAEADKGKKQA